MLLSMLMASIMCLHFSKQEQKFLSLIMSSVFLFIHLVNLYPIM